MKEKLLFSHPKITGTNMESFEFLQNLKMISIALSFLKDVSIAQNMVETMEMHTILILFVPANNK